MNEKILFIGLDVDEKNFHGYAISETDPTGTPFKTKANLGALLKALEKLAEPSTKIRICYESTYCGFHLCRGLQKAGFDCSVIAASLIPEVAGQKVKNDRLDAEKLARYFCKGILTAVYVPGEEDEHVRALVRSRTFMRGQGKELKRHMISLTKQLGWGFREEFGEASAYWTDKYRTWLKQKIANSTPVVRLNFEMLLLQLDAVEREVEKYALEIGKIAKEPKYDSLVKALICHRGVDVLTAMILITELGDIRRFPHPKKLTSYVGLDIAEYSSGGKERRFSMTKMGNKHVRKILTEAVQSARRPVLLSKELRRRREGTDPKYVDIADRCMVRLHKKSSSLLFKGKPVNKVKAACAREMLGFIWESMKLAT